MNTPRHIATAAIAATALLAELTGCGGNSTAEATRPTPSSTSTGAQTTASTSLSPTPAPTAIEGPKKQAQRLATEQTQAYIDAAFAIRRDPDQPLAQLDAYAQGKALTAIKKSIQGTRDDGQRVVGDIRFKKTWLGPEGVIFSHGGAVVDLYVCFDLGGAHFVDDQGVVTPVTPQVAQARYAIYAKTWPNSTAGDWRVGKEFASGEPCSR